MSQAQSRQPVLLRDYRPPAFLTPSIELEFVLEPDATLVTARQRFERNPKGSGDLALRGEDQELLAIKLDGVPLSSGRYRTSPSASRSSSPVVSTPRPTPA